MRSGHDERDEQLGNQISEPDAGGLRQPDFAPGSHRWNRRNETTTIKIPGNFIQSFHWIVANGMVLDLKGMGGSLDTLCAKFDGPQVHFTPDLKL